MNQTTEEMLLAAINDAINTDSDMFAGPFQIKTKLRAALTAYETTVAERDARLTHEWKASKPNEVPALGKEAFIQQYALTCRRNGVTSDSISRGLRDNTYLDIYNKIVEISK